MNVPLHRSPAAPTDVTSGAVAAAPRPVLGLTDAVALIVGTVIGAGIFRTPPLVAANAGSENTALVAWAAGGVVSLVGALCYAELASAYPNAGGEYHYLSRAFGRKLGFLFAWARTSVIQTGSIALLAFVLGDYASHLYRLGPSSSTVYAAVAVVILTTLNVAGVRQGKVTQNVLTAIEVVGLLLIVVAGLVLAGAREPAATAIAPAPATPAMGLVMVFVLLTYGGWNEAAYLSAEIRDPRRNIVRAFLVSLGLVTVLYLLVNWTLLTALGLSGVARSEAVVADVVRGALGDGGATLVSIFIVVTAATSANAAVFTGARTLYALGHDFPRLAQLGRWNGAARTPANALLAQGAFALGLVLLGAFTRKGFETMVEYTAPVFWLFLLLSGVSLLVLRRRERDAPRPFRVPFYPITPIVFCATCAYLLYSSLMYAGVGAVVGVVVLLVGAVALALTARSHRSARPPTS